MTTVIGCTETKAYAMKVNTVMKMQITHLSRVWVGQVRVLFLCVISGRQKQKRKENAQSHENTKIRDFFFSSDF